MVYVQTVLGSLNPENISVTLPHEHIICDASLCRSYRDSSEILPWGSYMCFDEPKVMIEELQHFKTNGGGCVVDATCHGWGRDPLALKNISMKSGIHIITTTGFYVEDCMLPWVSKQSVEQLADWIVREIKVGCNAKLSDDVTDVRAGVIKTSVSRPHFSQEELKGLMAVANAHLRTGAPITSHNSRSIFFELEGGNIGMELLDILVEEGIDPEAVIVGHTDMNPDIENLTTLAKRGVWVQFDLIGKPQFIPDETRADLIVELKDKGFLSHLLLSQDRSLKPKLCRYGGPGYSDLITRFCPMLRERGISNKDIDTLLIRNPSKALRIREVHE